MKKIVLFIALAAFLAAPTLAHAYTIRNNVRITTVKLTPGTANSCEIGYYYNTSSWALANVVEEDGSEALCSVLQMAMLNGADITSAELTLYIPSSGSHEVVEYLLTRWGN